jgi:uncharacterized protein (DUF885 family)
VWPGQATSCKACQLAMLRMRDEAEEAPGARFGLSAFHELVLTSGPMPLAVLEDLVQEWITAQQGTPD